MVKVALIHAQFETIHPFLDGNGRIGRLLIAALFEHWGLLPEPLMYLSGYLKQHQAEYYRRLSAIRTEGDWESWVTFFLEGVATAASDAEKNITEVASLVASDRRRLLQSAKAGPASYRLFEMLPMMAPFTIERARQQLDTSFPTATAAVKVLEELGIVTEMTGQKKTGVTATKPTSSCSLGDQHPQARSNPRQCSLSSGGQSARGQPPANIHKGSDDLRALFCLVLRKRPVGTPCSARREFVSIESGGGHPNSCPQTDSWTQKFGRGAPESARYASPAPFDRVQTGAGRALAAAWRVRGAIDARAGRQKCQSDLQLVQALPCRPARRVRRWHATAASARERGGDAWRRFPPVSRAVRPFGADGAGASGLPPDHRRSARPGRATGMGRWLLDPSRSAPHRRRQPQSSHAAVTCSAPRPIGHRTGCRAESRAHRLGWAAVRSSTLCAGEDLVASSVVASLTWPGRPGSPAGHPGPVR